MILMEYCSVMITSIDIQEQVLHVGNVYGPANSSEWVKWIDRTIQRLRELGATIQIIGGDWNQTFQEGDRTSRKLPSMEIQAAFKTLLEVLGNESDSLIDVAEANSIDFDDCDKFTHYNSRSGASRVNRIYVSHALKDRTQDYKILTPPISTDHQVVCATIRWDTPLRGKGRWRLNPLLLEHALVIRGIKEIKEAPWPIMKK
ncbi:hypothetical protein GcM3_001033 [Golovinomyces cichoracearum]|uniref:Endonuclease/exonuclease/phosphatase domain-containing protein n=1 Tax=Golovinomyces cichoracearum TaxID=62708 RepID=A0A420JBG2_9PEZI|nr:hypothetical protein GcM3_001033 [Golovinomyces cichoracearum]